MRTLTAAVPRTIFKSRVTVGPHKFQLDPLKSKFDFEGIKRPLSYGVLSANPGIDDSTFHFHDILPMVICHKLVLKSVSYPKIVENTSILIQQSIACNIYI